MSNVTPRGTRSRYTARQRRWLLVADALNGLRDWADLFSVDPPLEMMDAGGFPVLRVNTLTGSPFSHPWKVQLSTDGRNATVLGGHVNDGRTWTAVAGLASAPVASGDKWWLSVTYYNSPSAVPVYVLAKGTTFPSPSHVTDTLPVAGSETSLPASGRCTVILPVASYTTADGLQQYLFEDVLVPYGRTYTVDVVIGKRWDGATLELIVAAETWVCGVLREVGTPRALAILGYDHCPDEE